MKPPAVDKITYFTALSAFLGIVLAVFLSEESHKVIWPTGILYLIVGIIHTFIYVRHGLSNYSKMDTIERMVWTKRFVFGLFLIIGGTVFLWGLSN